MNPTSDNLLPRATKRSANSCISTDLYQYQPLVQLNNIRLLHLAPGTSDEQVSCTISHASRDIDVVYECLSYTWGDSIWTHSIQCEGKILPVTSNLFSALRQLRCPDRDRILWVDAICINQDDLYERNHQVSIMRDIYHGAKRVLVWLGDEIESDEMVFDLIREFEKDPSKRTRKEPLNRHDPNFKKTFNDQITLELCGAFSKLVLRPWFFRVWVIQEVVMARTAEVLCGSLRASWDALASMIGFFRENRMEYVFATTPFAWSSISMMASTRALRIKGPQHLPSLLAMLGTTQLNQITDPRDRIFALLGIAYDSLSIGIGINYALKCEELYKRVARHYLATEKNLACFSFIGNRFQSSPMKLPSWAPNWHLSTTPTFLPPLLGSGFTASLDSTLSLSISDSDVLTISGFVIDVVRRTRPKEITWSNSLLVADSDEFQQQEVGKLTGMLAECDELVALTDPYPTGELSSDAFWRTLICNRLPDGKIPGAEYSGVLAFYRHCFKHWDRLIRKEYDREQDSFLVQGYPMVQPFGTSVDKWSSGRSFGVTEKRYMGYVPRTAERGDLVCLFFGAEIPYVLRKAPSGHYEILGECYIHGIMEGQAMAWNDRTDQQFEIR